MSKQITLYLFFVLAFASIAIADVANNLYRLQMRHRDLVIRNNKAKIALQTILDQELKRTREKALKHGRIWREDGITDDEIPSFWRLEEDLKKKYGALDIEYAPISHRYNLISKSISKMAIKITKKPAIDMPRYIQLMESFERDDLQKRLLAVYLMALAAKSTHEGLAQLNSFGKTIHALINANKALGGK